MVRTGYGIVLRQRIRAGVWLLLLAGLLPLHCLAQLSSPIGGLSGSGPGVHSPDSPFAPLPQRTDVVPWSLLSDVKLKKVSKRLLPEYPPTVQELTNKTQRVQGFMMPLAPGQRHKHFLLTSVPMTCSFCTPGGPESMVEVKADTTVAYSLEPVVVEGKFMVLADDPYGLYYRIVNAVAVK